MKNDDFTSLKRLGVDTSYTGNELGTVVNRPLGAVFFDYDINLIHLLLGRGDARGIRFHFNRPRPENPTALYAAACGENLDIRDPDEVVKDDYFKPDGTAVMYARLPELVKYPPGSYGGNTCVFFSQALLSQYLIDSQTVAIRFYVVGYNVSVGSTSLYMSLVAVGIDNEGQPRGQFLMSEEPCPPNCPTGGIYP